MFGGYNQNGTSSYVEDPLKNKLFPDFDVVLLPKQILHTLFCMMIGDNRLPSII